MPKFTFADYKSLHLAYNNAFQSLNLTVNNSDLFEYTLLEHLDVLTILKEAPIDKFVSAPVEHAETGEILLELKITAFTKMRPGRFFEVKDANEDVFITICKNITAHKDCLGTRSLGGNLGVTKIFHLRLDLLEAALENSSILKFMNEPSELLYKKISDYEVFDEKIKEAVQRIKADYLSNGASAYKGESAEASKEICSESSVENTMAM